MGRLNGYGVRLPIGHYCLSGDDVQRYSRFAIPRGSVCSQNRFVGDLPFTRIGPETRGTRDARRSPTEPRLAGSGLERILMFGGLGLKKPSSTLNLGF